SDELLRRVEGSGIGRLLALTPSPDVNSLAVIHFSRHFGRSQVFQLALSPDHAPIDARVKGDVALELIGRVLFRNDLTFDELNSLFSSGHTMRRTLLTREFDFNALESRDDCRVIPLFVADPGGEVIVCTAEVEITPQPGQFVIGLAAVRAEVGVST